MISTIRILPSWKNPRRHYSRTMQWYIWMDRKCTLAPIVERTWQVMMILYPRVFMVGMVCNITHLLWCISISYKWPWFTLQYPSRFLWRDTSLPLLYRTSLPLWSMCQHHHWPTGRSHPHYWPTHRIGHILQTMSSIGRVDLCQGLRTEPKV
jgi:hypothetical protein